MTLKISRCGCSQKQMVQVGGVGSVCLRDWRKKVACGGKPKRVNMCISTVGGGGFCEFVRRRL